MGEELAARESIYRIYGYQADLAYLGEDDALPINETACLNSFTANKLKYLHNAVFGYTKSQFKRTSEAALMFKHKSHNGATMDDY